LAAAVLDDEGGAVTRATESGVRGQLLLSCAYPPLVELGGHPPRDHEMMAQAIRVCGAASLRHKMNDQSSRHDQNEETGYGQD
jgi:hypothetical protein